MATQKINIKEAIAKFISKHPENAAIDAVNMPQHFYVRWHNNSGMHYFNPTTGKLYNGGCPTDLLTYTKPKRVAVTFYVIADGDVMSLCCASTNALTSRKEEKREWQRITNCTYWESGSWRTKALPTYYFVKGDKTPYLSNGEKAEKLSAPTPSWRNDGSFYLSVFTKTSSYFRKFAYWTLSNPFVVNHDAIKTMNDFFASDSGNVWLGGERYGKMTNGDDVADFFAHKRFSKTTKSNKTIQIETDIDDLISALPTKYEDTALMTYTEILKRAETMCVPGYSYEKSCSCSYYVDKLDCFVKDIIENDQYIVLSSINANIKLDKQYDRLTHPHPMYGWQISYTKEEKIRMFGNKKAWYIHTMPDSAVIFNKATKSMYVYTYGDRYNAYSAHQYAWNKVCALQYNNEIDDTAISQDVIDKLQLIKGFQYYDFSNCTKLIHLMRIITHPEIEQLTKMGALNIVKHIENSSAKSVMFKTIFGTELRKKKKYKVLDNIKMTAPQLKRYNDMLDSGFFGLEQIKDLLNISDFKSFDNNKFQMLLNMSKALYNGFTHYERINIRYYVLPLNNGDYESSLKLVLKLSEEDDTVFSTWKDLSSTYRRLQNNDEIELNVSTASDLHRLHDYLVELYNEQLQAEAYEQNKKLDEAMKRRDEERSVKFKSGFETNKYFIRLPEKASEITLEGQLLKHCVGGYAHRHAEGHTNIIFLRKKESPSTPFYTIEVNNSNEVVQIHGYCNKWIGNDPDAIPTVVQWLKLCGIHCKPSILLCTSTGYGSNNQYLDGSRFGLPNAN